MGSHDSASYSITQHSRLAPHTPGLTSAPLFTGRLGRSFFVGWSRTQLSSLIEQLSAGIRYLDLRVAVQKIRPTVPAPAIESNFETKEAVGQDSPLGETRLANRLQTEYC
ncbi:unnamed protein product [Protopolystoma xenopodis]|uniref:Uncharacterized protein n=1 Tax=Protopolystoma xenopodis TaxID=117903 RepID=A0A448XH04_9PLAT|nr:unnamed protein product [Protopolystoma xenopodis]